MLASLIKDLYSLITIAIFSQFRLSHSNLSVSEKLSSSLLAWEGLERRTIVFNPKFETNDRYASLGPIKC